MTGRTRTPEQGNHRETPNLQQTWWVEKQLGKNVILWAEDWDRILDVWDFNTDVEHKIFKNCDKYLNKINTQKQKVFEIIAKKSKDIAEKRAKQHKITLDPKDEKVTEKELRIGMTFCKKSEKINEKEYIRRTILSLFHEIQEKMGNLPIKDQKKLVELSRPNDYPYSNWDIYMLFTSYHAICKSLREQKLTVNDLRN